MGKSENACFTDFCDTVHYSLLVMQLKSAMWCVVKKNLFNVHK